MTANVILFWILAVVSVGAALTMVASRNPVRSALMLVITFLAVAVLYLTLAAQFIAAVQVVVYAGAIMVLFLFVIMLLNLAAPQAMKDRGSLQPMAALVLAAIFIIVLVASQSIIAVPRIAALAGDPGASGTVRHVGLELFSPTGPWLFPFELTSLLLLVAVVGAIMLAKRRMPGGSE
ncbi:MAG: NADH-quinone oxidoreductase subunit J [Armatimonadetes bacterium]|nr:NADH-quinone oxidoreductase subunit J [Armatimonadota bacterium]MDE2206726.1 NADH-quinone oxidoreductase subunit J [Armatimonadota bacterium]